METIPKRTVTQLQKFVRLKHGNLKKATEITGVSTSTLKNILRGCAVSLDIKEKIVSNLKNLN
ncbi:hypothetical protein ACFOW1_01570 [Parasediminibacterium paludis]|uniref:HTH cro/C1-type domain-containing protein n=1 Tax=Parasediminibacterium paludis TaxID=908966 RepID=A0ABV8PUY7_9BACT